jgi:hypothetical protein
VYGDIIRRISVIGYRLSDMGIGYGLSDIGYRISVIGYWVRFGVSLIR